MSDLCERLQKLVSDDHQRGCEGRTYSCSCGYDDLKDKALVKAAAEIARLRAELEEARGLILDLCDELEPYVEEKWGYDERLKRQYDRDMEPAVKGRAYLERQDRQ